MPINVVHASSLEYTRDYNRGWRAGDDGESTYATGDALNASDAWYDGYADCQSGRPKWTWKKAHLAGFDRVEDYVVHRAEIKAAPRKKSRNEH